MSQGAAINVQRRRNVRQSEATRPRPTNSGFVFFPVDQLDQEPQSGAMRREEGQVSLAAALLLALAVGAAAWFLKGALTNLPPTALPTNTPTVATREVNTFELNMRESPSLNAPIKFILPRSTKVEVLGEHQQGFDNGQWVKVRVQTREGPQEGWVDPRFIQ